MKTKRTELSSIKVGKFVENVRNRSIIAKQPKHVFNTLEYNSNGKEVFKPLTRFYQISNSYSEQAFIECGLISKLLNGNLQWCGGADINNAVQLLKKWMIDYSVRLASEKYLAKLAKKDADKLNDLFTEPLTVEGTFEVKSEPIEIFGELIVANGESTEPTVEQSQEEQLPVNLLMLKLDEGVQIIMRELADESGDVSLVDVALVQLNRILTVSTMALNETIKSNEINASILAELQKLNLSKVKKKCSP